MPEMRQTAVRLTVDDDAARPQKTHTALAGKFGFGWVLEKCGKSQEIGEPAENPRLAARQRPSHSVIWTRHTLTCFSFKR